MNQGSSDQPCVKTSKPCKKAGFFPHSHFPQMDGIMQSTQTQGRQSHLQAGNDCRGIPGKTHLRPRLGGLPSAGVGGVVAGGKQLALETRLQELYQHIWLTAASRTRVESGFSHLHAGLPVSHGSPVAFTLSACCTSLKAGPVEQHDKHPPVLPACTPLGSPTLQTHKARSSETSSVVEVYEEHGCS